MLGQQQSSQLVQFLGSLFPRWKTNPDLVSLWVNRLARFPVTLEQATAIVEQHRVSRRGSDPDLGGIEAAMRAAAESDRASVPAAVQIQGNAGAYVDNGPTPEERCERYARGGVEAWVADGFERRWWPAMESVVKDWQAGKPVSSWSIMRRALSGSRLGAKAGGAA